MSNIPNIKARMYLGSKLLSLIVLGSLLIGAPSVTLNMSLAVHGDASRAQPHVLTLAAQQPDTRVNVIVQKRNQNQAVEQRVVRLGGTITKEFTIINAFVAELSASAAIALTEMEDVRWVSLDAPVIESGCDGCVSTANLTAFPSTSVRADKVWSISPNSQGEGITVAVVDSGINSSHPSLKGRVLADVKVSEYQFMGDYYGHGTFVAGIIAGTGDVANGIAPGIAPRANLISVKVTSMAGAASESDVVAGLQWVYDNRDTYKIRVVNISFNSTLAQPYQTSPVNAACEFLWFNGIVVVVSAGNNGSATLYPPANDPFVITVGATDQKGTSSISDDTLANFSAYGVLPNGTVKPDLVAPGRNLVGPLNSIDGILAKLHPANVISQDYFRMSGTSASAPVVSGAVALLLQDEPNLTPDQVKHRLMAKANKSWSGYNAEKAGAGYLDTYAAVQATTLKTANSGQIANDLLATAVSKVTNTSVNWSSVNWSSVNWSSVNWSSVNWSMPQR